VIDFLLVLKSTEFFGEEVRVKPDNILFGQFLIFHLCKDAVAICVGLHLFSIGFDRAHFEPEGFTPAHVPDDLLTGVVQVHQDAFVGFRLHFCTRLLEVFLRHIVYGVGAQVFL